LQNIAQDMGNQADQYTGLTAAGPVNMADLEQGTGAE
jgi:hypothetical protein